MCAKFIASQHKHPETPRQTLQFIQHRNAYIAWALQILDRQRRALAGHVQPVRGMPSWGNADDNGAAHTHEPAPSGFMPPKIKRYLG